MSARAASRAAAVLGALLALVAGCAHAPPSDSPSRTARTSDGQAPCPDGARIGSETSGEAPSPPVPAGKRRRASIFRVDRTPPEAQPLIARHCPRGRPRWWSSPPPASLDLVARAGYVLEHSAEDKVALFVCARVDPADLGGDVARKEAFAADPALAPGRRAELSDYKGSGFSRGHQAPSADQTTSRERNDETFLLSNMTPQLQALNGGAWAQLEKKVRAWAQRYGEVWVVTGPMFHDPAEEDPATADGVVEHDVVGAGAVSVPTHYFKIVVARTGGAWRAVAFVLPHAAPPKGASLASAIVPIDWIEARTGLDVMPELSADEARWLEAEPGTMWE